MTPERRTAGKISSMSAEAVDAYLAKVDEPKRTTLETVRRSILAVIPEAKERFSHGVPGSRSKARGRWLRWFQEPPQLPAHSGSVLAKLANDLAAYECTKGALHFGVDDPLPANLVRRLITTRMRELELNY